MQSLVPVSNSFTSFPLKHAHFNVEKLPMVKINQNFNTKTECKKNSLRAYYMAINRFNTPQTSSSFDYEEDLRANKYYKVELQVKEEDIDANGIVEASVYSSYCQHGHDEMRKNVGLTIGGNCKSTTPSSFSSKIFTPLIHGDKFSVNAKVSCISTTSIFVETYIFRIPDHELILQAEAEIVLLGKNYCPVRISPGVRAKLLLLDSIDRFD